MNTLITGLHYCFLKAPLVFHFCCSVKNYYRSLRSCYRSEIVDIYFTADWSLKREIMQSRKRYFYPPFEIILLRFKENGICIKKLEVILCHLILNEGPRVHGAESQLLVVKDKHFVISSLYNPTSRALISQRWIGFRYIHL